MRESNYASITLTDCNKEQLKILNLSDKNSVREAIEFIEKYTDIEFPKYDFL